MKKRTILLLTCIAFLTACKTEEPKNCICNETEFIADPIPNTSEYSLTFQENSAIEIKNNQNFNEVSIIEGNKLVFEFKYVKDDEPFIADDELTETILFEIDDNSDSFELIDNDLEDASVVFGRFCFCVDAGYHLISNGCINGQKLADDKWQINMSIVYKAEYDTITKNISEVFILE